MPIQALNPENMTQKTAHTCLIVSALLLFLLFLQPVAAQYNFSELDTRLQQYQKQLGNDVAVLVYKNGQTVYRKEMGSFNSQTVAPIASCSKWFTAALVMSFVDEGKLSLDDKVSQYLPVFTSYSKGQITIRHCLSHLTGIHTDKPGLLSILKMSRYRTLEDEVNELASKQELEEVPGTSFRYSNAGLDIAGRVLEVMAKKPFEQLMQQRIFRPLGMKNSSFASEKAVHPSGGARSTAGDYLNFLVMLLNKGVYNGKRILSEKAVEEMQVPRTTTAMIKYAPAPAEGYNYGYGEWIQETNNQGKSTVVSCPGLFGTWPLIDNQRGYAMIVFVKTLLREQNRDIYLQLKQAVDAAVK